MPNDLQTNNHSSEKYSVELIEGILSTHNLAKDQIISQDISQLRQSLITLNSLISSLKYDSSNLNQQSDNLLNNFDKGYFLLSFIQRKSLIINRYKKLLKKSYFNKIKDCVGNLDDSNTKEELKVLLNKLEYIENNGQNISGQLQNLIE
jgi:hypothetical protein